MSEISLNEAAIYLVTIIGNPAKNGENGMQVKKLVFPDGHELPGTILPSDSLK
jgi:hypothetical protein